MSVQEKSVHTFADMGAPSIFDVALPGDGVRLQAIAKQMCALGGNRMMSTVAGEARAQLLLESFRGVLYEFG